MNTVEPVPGGIPQEATSYGLTAFERLKEILKLQAQESDKYDSKLRGQLYEAKRQLTKDVVSLLESTANFSVDDKLKLVQELIPHVEWGYEEADFFEHDEARKTRAKEDQIASED